MTTQTFRPTQQTGSASFLPVSAFVRPASRWVTFSAQAFFLLSTVGNRLHPRKKLSHIQGIAKRLILNCLLGLRPMGLAYAFSGSIGTSPSLQHQIEANYGHFANN